MVATGPYLYKYTLSEAYHALRKVGFKVTAVGSREQITRGVMYKSVEEMEGKPIRKPSTLYAQKSS